MLSPAQESELLDLRRTLTEGPLDTDDLTAVENAVAKQHLSLQYVQDPSQPWSGHNRAPCRALLIVGAFRAGKTVMAKRAISRLKPFSTPEGELAVKFVQVTASPTFNIEQLGRDILGRLLQLPARSLGPSRTMERVHRNFSSKHPTGLYIDEAQRIAKPDRVSAQRLREEQVKGFGHLRDIMDFADWPVPIVLTGTPELLPTLELKEMGFFRDRMDVILLAPMSVGTKKDRSDMISGLATYASLAGIKVDLKDMTQFADRLIHSVNGARGLGFEVCRDAIMIACSQGRRAVSMEDFATYYTQKTSCARHANPFVAADWHRVDPKILVAAVTGDKVQRIWETAR